MKFNIKYALVVGILSFGAVLSADQNCVEAANRIFDKLGLPEFGEHNMFEHEQSQAVDLTSMMPYSGFGTLDNGRGYRISNNYNRNSLIVDVADPIIDSKTLGQPVAIVDSKTGHGIGKRKKKNVEQRSNLYRYSFSVVGNECQLNQVEVTSNVERETPITAENTIVVDAAACQSAMQPDSPTDQKVKIECSWFTFYPKMSASAD